MSHLGRDPFATPVDRRDPARRLRSRLPLPVTVWTTRGWSAGAAGLTVSSVIVAEGEPAAVVGLVGPLTDFWDALSESRRFVVHVLGVEDHHTADLFTGRWPVTDPFDQLAVRDSPWGPVLDGVGTRAYCELGETTDVGYSRMIQGHIDHIDLEPRRVRPLAYFRGTYQTIRSRSAER